MVWVVLGSSTAAENTVLLLSVQAGAVLRSALESGGYSLCDHAGLL